MNLFANRPRQTALHRMLHRCAPRGVARLFHVNSIRKKLFLLVILNGSLAVILIGLLLFGYQKVETREAAKRELSSQAGIVADSSVAALTFQDERSATETLNALRANVEIVQAGIYSTDGRLFASYERKDPEVGPISRNLQKTGAWLSDGYIAIAQPIRLGNQVIGIAFLRASMKDAEARLRRDMGFVSMALVASLGLALLLTASMQRTIVRPVAELSRVARRVSIKRDYSARAFKSANDEIGFLVDAFNEMLAQIEVREHALRESEERYALAARGSNDGLWDWKLTTNELYLSPRWNQMLGYVEAERWTNPDFWLSRIHPADRDRVLKVIAAHREGSTSEFATEYRIRQHNGAYLWVLSRGIAVRDTYGTAVRIAGSQTDITQGKVADPLTGLPNRLYFLDRLESALDAVEQNARGFAVLFLDLDRFKLVNDSMGHASGDALLDGVAKRLRESTRKALQNADSSSVARIGGDEFAILVDGIRQPAEATRLAECLLHDLAPAFPIHGRQVFVSVSIGIAMSSSGSTPEELLRNADTAMYHAKTGGKARFATFDEGMREEAVARLEIETELRKAVDDRQFVVHYQPQVSIATRRLTGFEALVRWNHPERGMVPPDKFIPVAEETGLILPLGKWVLREACRQMSEWQENYAIAPRLTIAVNVSFEQMAEKSIVEEVNGVLRDTGLAPGALRLEMTESAVMKDPSETIETLRRLKELGLAIEIDDFGTGYSSLSYLSCLPIDTVKIDRSFIRELDTQEDRAEIVRTILELARSLHLDVVAEGVETEAQLGRLDGLGCQRAQGYLFSKPLPASAIPLLFEVEALKQSFGMLERQAGILNTEVVSISAPEDAVPQSLATGAETGNGRFEQEELACT